MKDFTGEVIDIFYPWSIFCSPSIGPFSFEAVIEGQQKLPSRLGHRANLMLWTMPKMFWSVDVGNLRMILTFLQSSTGESRAHRMNHERSTGNLILEVLSETTMLSSRIFPWNQPVRLNVGEFSLRCYSESPVKLLKHPRYMTLYDFEFRPTCRSLAQESEMLSAKTLETIPAPDLPHEYLNTTLKTWDFFPEELASEKRLKGT